ncbi:unnamed protein product [Lactuca saligna]|uniref:BHLH domain-containing protein n=1 Tax=Lactuca saligna TaxID=75948 RepID=A0AA36EQX0_LACSI|nr:unnamed protein product [Lactuca saligna]
MVEGLGKASINLPLSVSMQKAEKQVINREIERRREMRQLYASLTSILPIELVKRKRSVPAHLLSTVHYIKEKQENIKEMSTKRDRLKKLFDTNESLVNHLSNTVSVKFCNGMVDIVINSCLEEGFAFSQVLDAIIKEGINIESCTSTKINNRLLHSIHSEVSEKALIDPSMLQRRLVLVANTWSNVI